jgi:hypothetical protein
MERIDITRQKFNRLTAISYAGDSKWNCVCDCGTERKVDTYLLRSGQTKSCGCYQREAASNYCKKNNLKHNLSRFSGSDSWYQMIARCHKPHNKNYRYYGERGIKVCERWLKLENFIEDMGERPDGYTLDRIDVDGDYCKENCRWTTRLVQSNNKRDTVFLTYNGETKSIHDWSRSKGLEYDALRGRLRLGWSLERALNTPKNFNLSKKGRENGSSTRK